MVLVALVAPEDIGQYGGFVGVLAPRPRLQGAAAGPDLGVGNDEDLHVGVRADHGTDVAAIEHGARRIGGELPLKIQQYLAQFRKSRDHRSGVAHDLRLQGGVSEFFGIELKRRRDGEHLVCQVGAGIQQRLGDRAVDHAGIEVTIAVMVGEPLAERALA